MQTKPVSTAERLGRIIGFIAAILIFQFFVRQLFESPPGGGINFLRLLCAGLMGGGGVLVGGLIGRSIAGLKRS